MEAGTVGSNSTKKRMNPPRIVKDTGSNTDQVSHLKNANAKAPVDAAETMEEKVEGMKGMVADQMEAIAEKIVDNAPERGAISRGATALAAQIETMGDYLDKHTVRQAATEASRFLIAKVPVLGRFAAKKSSGSGKDLH